MITDSYWSGESWIFIQYNPEQLKQYTIENSKFVTGSQKRSPGKNSPDPCKVRHMRYVTIQWKYQQEYLEDLLLQKLSI